MWKETTAKPRALGEKCRSVSFAKANRRRAPGWICEPLFLCGLTRHLQYITLGLLRAAHPKVGLGHGEQQGSELVTLESVGGNCGP